MSILGLVIGVAALVGVLSLGDGLEVFAREQIEQTTDLNMITVQARTTDTLDGIRVVRPDAIALHSADAASLRDALEGTAYASLASRASARIGFPDDTLAAATFVVYADEGAPALLPGALVHGRWPTADEFRSGALVAIANATFLERLLGREAVSDDVGRDLMVDTTRVVLIGIIAPDGSVPVGLALPRTDDDARSASLYIKVPAVEEVPAVRERIETWADTRWSRGRDAIILQSNEFRVEQAQRGVRLFKVIMGLITGISVVVGGVGIMNVMMMAVTDRTREIGVRKAAGARRKDIVFQFMVESVAISAVGALVGLVVGLLAVFAVTPVIRALTEVPFRASFTPGSFLVVVIIAAVVGIVFGTYPAYRAARLRPVDAIRHE